MAPEALEEKKYSKYSDVWSFGITMWEIFNLGKNPYPSYANNELMKFIKEGMRLPKPMYSDGSDGIYNLMEECWMIEMRSRPR